MDLFRRFFGPRLPPIDNPDQLREHLFAAALTGDRARLAALCRQHQEMAAANFAAWQRVPEPLRGDPAQVQRYIHGLVSVAEFFADSLGRPELLQRLTGNAESNPIVRWQEKLQQAGALMEELRHADAAALLTDVLIDVRDLEGSAVERYLPITQGRLGECYFQGGKAAKAVAPTENALAFCERHGDAEGVKAYLGNLYEIRRYLGEAGPAADAAERLADVLAGQGDAAGAAHWRKQAGLVRAGEPLNRVVAVVEVRRFELDEVPPLRGDGRVQFAFERNRLTLRPAEQLTERGERLGGAGNFEEALALFRDAARADPFAPHPHYLEGWTLLHLERYEQAVDAYEAAEERAPGWYNCRADLWLARQLALGRLDRPAFLALGALEDGPEPPADKVRLAETALGHFPNLAPLHLHHGKNLAALKRLDEARAASRKGLACGDEPDVRTRLLVQLAVIERDEAEKTRLLREACGLRGHLVSHATAVVMLRASAR
jgi:tetratricopeptide (TPR) repeat protein